ncbi:MAG: hypothetical protein ACJ77M_13875 [Thermoleophilaceae bacterium]
MLGLGTVNRLLLGGGARRLDTCLVCRHAVREDEQCLEIRGGRLVHRGCSTYRMRRQTRRR